MQRSHRILSYGAIALISVAAALMQSGLLRIGGIAPNSLVAALVVTAFFIENPLVYGLCALLASILMRATPVLLDPVALATVGIAVVLYGVQRRLVWPSFSGAALLSVVGVIGMYGMTQPSFLWQEPVLLLQEIVYTVGVAVLLFGAMKFFFGDAIRH